MKLIPGKLYRVTFYRMWFQNETPLEQKKEYSVEKGAIIMFVEYQEATDLEDLEYGEPIFLVGECRVCSCSNHFDRFPEKYLEEV